MDVQIIACDTEFNNLRDEWSLLLSKVSDSNPFMSHEWLQTWWEVYGSGELYIITGRDSATGDLVGILPLYRVKTSNLLPIYALRFLGSKQVSSDFLDCFVALGWEEDFYNSCIEILQQKTCHWDILEFQDMDETSQFHIYLKKTSFSGLYLTKDPGNSCPYLKLPDSWDDLLQQLSKKERKRVGYYRRRLEKKGTLECESVTDMVALPDALNDLIILRNDRLERKGLASSRVTDTYHLFHSCVMARFLECGKLRLYFLLIDGERVAFTYLFTGSNSIFFYQTGFNHLWSSYNVGSVLLGLVIEQAINDGYSTFEFLRGRERYKYQWGDIAERSLVTVTIFGNTPRGFYCKIQHRFMNVARSIKNSVKLILNKGN